MKEIKTLEDALALAPEYWYLTPDDKVRHGDQWYYAPRESWEGIPAGFYGVLIRLVGSDGYPCRRPIPKSVQEAEARKIIWEKWRWTWSNGNGQNDDTPEVMHPPLDATDYDCIDYDDSCVEDSERIDILGGQIEVYKMLTEPTGIWRWVQENRK